MKVSLLAQPVGLLMYMLTDFTQVIFKGENCADMILWNIRLMLSCVRTLGVKLNTTKLYILIAV